MVGHELVDENLGARRKQLSSGSANLCSKGADSHWPLGKPVFPCPESGALGLSWKLLAEAFIAPSFF